MDVQGKGTNDNSFDVPIGDENQAERKKNIKLERLLLIPVYSKSSLA